MSHTQEKHAVLLENRVQLLERALLKRDNARRWQAAVAAMQGILGNNQFSQACFKTADDRGLPRMHIVAVTAMSYADNLLAEAERREQGDD